jgi:hypothetical protein
MVFLTIQRIDGILRRFWMRRRMSFIQGGGAKTGAAIVVGVGMIAVVVGVVGI